MKRVFVAIPISSRTYESALEWKSRFKSFPVRWLAPKNLHITLIPPWYAHENDIGQVTEKLRDAAASVRPFSIAFDRVEFGPNFHAPRLIWAHGSTPAEIVELRDRIAHALGQKLDQRPVEGRGPHGALRPFTAHLTLARFRPEEFPRFPIKKISGSIDWREEIRSVALMEAHLHPSGAEYEILVNESLDGV